MNEISLDEVKELLQDDCRFLVVEYISPTVRIFTVKQNLGALNIHCLTEEWGEVDKQEISLSPDAYEWVEERIESKDLDTYTLPSELCSYVVLEKNSQ